MIGFPVKDKFLSAAHVHVSLSVDYFKKFSVTQSSQRRYRLPGNKEVRASFSSISHSRIADLGASRGRAVSFALNLRIYRLYVRNCQINGNI
jgi:hypothetical protein